MSLVENRHGLAMRFRVEIDHVDLGSWSTCKGLGVQFESKRVQELGLNTHETIIPDVVTYPNIKLTRGIDRQSASLMVWLADAVNSTAIDFTSSDGVISLLDSQQEEVTSWGLRNVSPIAWTGPQLDASAKVVAIETLTLAHEGFLNV